MGSCRAPHPIFRVLHSKKRVLQGLKHVIEFFGATITKNPHFLAKNGQKKPFFGLKRCFWSVSGQL